MKNDQADTQKQIEIIREQTKKITASKEKALQYLEESGIAGFVKQAEEASRNECS